MKYADAKTITVAHPNNSIPDLQPALLQQEEWTHANNMKLNKNKSTAIQFCFTMSLPIHHTLHITGERDMHSPFGYDDLHRNANIKAIVANASRRLLILEILQSFGAPRGDLLAVWSSYIVPVIKYASPAWSNSLTTNLANSIGLVQKRAFRLILGSEFTSYKEALSTLQLSYLVEKRKKLTQFALIDNTGVQELPEGVFKDLSFLEIWVNSTALKRIHTSALYPSKDTIETLNVIFSPLQDFPFHLLPHLSRLKELTLWNTSLTQVTPIQSESLEVLRLGFNSIEMVEENGWSTPNLRELNFGLTPDTTVKLGYNRITNLVEEIFRPLLEVISQGDGVLYLEDVRSVLLPSWSQHSWDPSRTDFGHV
ncbi:unnamed protein product [Darwinula stevensoni]|uniref:Uncharacterized protein n=1 Tax=Darwinula stevensoni TaxID=69355 RepID=A0A7R9FR13_9CRUS|nr:unnamed protein product [Darwinula stevensoni]CAG0900766.1 unnamed protein product [Darwinula stevensoni]